MSTLKNKIRNLHLELGEVFDEKSSEEPTMTIPDESMTIPYILSRYVKGHPLGVERNAIDYATNNLDSPDWEKVKQMDLVDLNEFKEDLDQIEKAANHQKRQKELKEKRLAKEKAEAEKIKRSEELKNPQPLPPK